MTKPPSKLEKQFIDRLMRDEAKLAAYLSDLEIPDKATSLLTIALKPFSSMRREIIWDPHSSSRVDFGWRRLKLAVEIQGGIFGDRRKSRQGHASRAGFIKDYNKFNRLQLFGWNVLLLTPEDTNKLWSSHTLPLLGAHLAERITSAVQLLQVNRELHKLSGDGPSRIG